MSNLWAAVEPAARLVVAVLFNGLWQGALIAFAVWAILRVFPRANASTRYAAWSAALVAILLVPLVTTVPRVSAEASPATTSASPAIRYLLPPSLRLPGASAPVKKVVIRDAHAATVAAPQTDPRPGSLRLSAPAWLAVGLFALWIAASLATLLRLALSLVALERLKRDSLPLSVEYRDVMARWTGAAKGARDVRLCVSREIEVPVAVGLFDAMILLPQHLLDRLESHEIDQISLHELAHLRRADDWTNGLQRVAQALLFFNPAVAFVAHQMDLEREVACDDWVLALTGDVRPYAFCLTKMAEVTAWPHRALAAPGAFVTRKNISIRIERLLEAKRAIGSALAPGASSAVLAALIAAFFVLRTVTPSIAYTSPAGSAHAQLEGGTMPDRLASEPGPLPKDPLPKDPSPKATPAPHRGSPGPAATERPPAVVPGGPRTLAYVFASKVAAKIGGPPIARPAIPRPPAAMRTGNAFAFACLGCDMHGVSWAGKDMHGATLVGADLRDADLQRANFSKAHLSGVDFRGADLRQASFAGAQMQGCDLRGARLDGTDFTGASLAGCSVDVATLSAAQAAVLLRACIGCNFRGADLHGRDLRGVTLNGSDLREADLRDADLSHASFTGVDLSGAKLAGAKLDGTKFVGCDFRGVDLRGVDLSRADLTGSSLSHAVLR